MEFMWRELSLSDHPNPVKRSNIKHVLDLLMPLFAHILVPIFLVGMAGSAVVCVVTTFLDIQQFASDDTAEPTRDSGL